jgi:exopolysaccharide biosynthesis polyprenyl glycosylphosphotransferase
MTSSEQSTIAPRKFFGLKRERLGVLATEVAFLPRFLQHEWSPALAYIFLDVMSWVTIYGVVGWLRHDAFYETPLQFLVIDLVQLAVIVQALYFVGGYDRSVETRSLSYAVEHILTIIVAAAVSALLIYSAAAFDQTMKPSRGVLLVSFVAFLPISLLYRRFIRTHVVASTAQRAFLVIGSGDLAARFYETYKNSPNGQRLEFVDDDPARIGLAIAGENSPVVQEGIATHLVQLDRRYSGVILADSADRLSPQLLELLVRTQFQRTRVYTLESFHETHWRFVPLDVVDPVWPLQTGFQLARNSPYHYVKRLVDFIVSGALLIICSPLFGMIACLIWLTSGRLVIFRQTRVGREGHLFTAYKFRTMRSTNGDENDNIYTRVGDPRVTRLGRWLRRSRLDELPQLWNVFKGDMSLIGPRAEWIRCAGRYEEKIPFYHFRHLVKPGITGWAQVNYPYGESEEDAIEKLKYDLYYIRNYSLKLDAMIVLKTVYTMLFGKGR